MGDVPEETEQSAVWQIEASTDKWHAYAECIEEDIMVAKTTENPQREELKQKLVSLGYSRYDLIEGRGQFSVRGGIVDIATNEKVGIRIEFWGDDIDSIREFNIETQRSIKNIETATIYPAHEYILDEPAEKTCKKIKEKYSGKTIYIILTNILLLMLFIMCIVYLTSSSYNPFIYFRF